MKRYIYSSTWSGRITPRDVDDYSKTEFTKEQRKSIADAVNSTDVYTSGYFYKQDFLLDALRYDLFGKIAEELAKKQPIRSSDYIPDTTERYPEGKKSYVGDDYEDDPMQDTLENVINYLKEKYHEPYINEIEVFDKNGESELVTDSFDDVLQSYAVPSKMLCNDTVVDEENGKVEIYLA